VRRYHSRHLRAGRWSDVGRVYLITTATLGRAPLFDHWQAGRHVVQAFRQQQASGKADSLAWVVMPDHIHWLVRLMSGCLDQLVGEVKSHAALSFNQQAGRSGPLWQKGFHDRAMRREDDLKAAARYIIYNPVRAGLVQSPKDYCLWDAMWL
jgi:putative transposase